MRPLLNKKLWPVFFVGCLIGMASSMATAGLPDVKLPPYSTWTLPNGAKVIYLRDQTVPLTKIQAIFQVGAANDPAGQDGLMGLAGEMLVRGSKNLSKEQIRKKMEVMGADLNVVTGSRETVLSLTTLSEALGSANSVINEVLNNVKPNGTELSLLKNETLQDIRSFPDRGMSLTQSAFKMLADPENPYMRMGIGRKSTIPKISIAHIQEAQASILKGGNLTIAVVSDMDFEAINKFVESVFSKIPQGKTEPLVEPPVKKWTGVRVLVLDKKNQETVNTVLGQPATWAATPERAELVTTNYMFGQAPLVSVLFREIRANRGWTYGVNSQYSFAPYRGPYAISLFPTKKYAIDAFKLARELFTQYVIFGVPPSELEAAKKALINQAPFLVETSDDQMARILDEEIRGAPKGYFSSFVKRVSRVHEENSLEARKKVHDQTWLAAVFMGDAKMLVPEIKKLGEIESVTVIPVNDYLK